MTAPQRPPGARECVSLVSGTDAVMSLLQKKEKKNLGRWIRSGQAATEQPGIIKYLYKKKKNLSGSTKRRLRQDLTLVWKQSEKPGQSKRVEPTPGWGWGH